MIPAMKQARKSGLEVFLVRLPRPIAPLHDSLLAHADAVRSIAWPTCTAPKPATSDG
jgi:hypothetical protein